MKDDEIRSATARLLIGQMSRNSRLLDRCEAMVGPAGEADAVPALNAAARLSRASAAVAAQLARFAHVESRHRSTLDVNKPAKESQAELNREKNAVAAEDKRQMLLEKIQRLVAAENGGDDESDEKADDASDSAPSRA